MLFSLISKKVGVDKAESATCSVIEDEAVSSSAQFENGTREVCGLGGGSKGRLGGF